VDTPPSYKRFPSPAKIISHVVWLYHRFPPSFREVEELLSACGITVSHETIRAWCEKFGPEYAVSFHRRPQVGGKWHLDEVFIKVNSVRQYLWGAVEHRSHKGLSNGYPPSKGTLTRVSRSASTNPPSTSSTPKCGTTPCASRWSGSSCLPCTDRVGRPTLNERW
jgi:transposase-like protein